MSSASTDLVSVIVPICNVQKYLAECLESILAQTHRELEVICVNDGSKDASLAIIQNYAGGPVGLDTLAAAVGEESVTLEDVYEPYLMQIGFLTRTPRGRCVTRLAYNHLHLEAPDGVPDAQMTLSF